MAKIDASGADEIISMLNGLGKETETVCSMALYKGMGITVDAMREAVENLPTEPFHPLPGAPNSGDPLNVLTEDDKEDLLFGLGIAPFERTGNGVSSAASFEGYSRHASKQFPNGIPLPVIARSIESGSSVRKKHPFIRTMITSKENLIIQAMEETVHNAVDTYVTTGSLPPLDHGGGSHGGKGITRVLGKAPRPKQSKKPSAETLSAFAAAAHRWAMNNPK